MKMKHKDPIFYRCKESSFNEFAADLLTKKFKDLQTKERKINVALSGGSTPIPIFKVLKDTDINWEQFNFFMVDERCVPLDDERSNYNNINQAFLKHISANSFSMVKEDCETSEEIDRYTEDLLSNLELSANGIPKFDLILLGMGEDGHTASLFPKTEALNEKSQLVVKNYVPQLDTFRITLTYPVLKNAEEAIVIIKGTKKNAIIDELYASEASQYPMYELVNSELILNWILSE